MTSKESESEAQEAILKMSYAEILRYMDAVNVEGRMPICVSLTKRLYEIALYEHHVPNADRNGAWQRLGVVKAWVEEGLKDRPDAMAEYIAANAAMEEGARKVGIGTLPWLIREAGVESIRELAQLITRPENRHRLDELYAVLEPDLAALLRREIALRRD